MRTAPLSINIDGRMPAMRNRKLTARCIGWVSPAETRVVEEKLKKPALCAGDEEVAENLDTRDRFEFLGIDEIGVHRERVGLAEKLHQAAVFFDEVVGKHCYSETALTRAQHT